MSAALLDAPLACVVPYWRVLRRDGVALGFTAHDRDLWFDGLLHRAAPGIAPSAIRLVSALDGDTAGMEGPLAHDGIDEEDLASGRYDRARVVVGAVDWETGRHQALFAGTIGEVARNANGFEAQLRPDSDRLGHDTVPRTSPTCRARFCAPGCNLSPARFEHVAVLDTLDTQSGATRFTGLADPARFAFGSLRWLDGPACGQRSRIETVAGDLLTIVPAPAGQSPGARAILREGCDHTLATCAARFANAANFRGEAHLPGNDLLTRRAGQGG